jgi:phosphomannomutase
MVTASHNPPQDNGYKVYSATARRSSAGGRRDRARIDAVGRLADVPLGSGGRR